MKIHPASFSFENTDTAKAQALWNLFTHLLCEAVAERCHAEADIEGKRRANDVATSEWQKEDMGGCGFGPKLPYGEFHIKQAEKELETAKKSVEEAKSFMKFLRDRFLAGYELQKSTRKLEHEKSNLSFKNGVMENALERIATPKRPDGTYNLCREACEKLAKEALNEARTNQG